MRRASIAPRMARHTTRVRSSAFSGGGGTSDLRVMSHFWTVQSLWTSPLTHSGVTGRVARQLDVGRPHDVVARRMPSDPASTGSFSQLALRGKS